MSAALPHVDAFKKSELIVIGTAEGYGTHYPHLAHAHRRMTQSAVACVPLELQGRILGVVVLGFPLPWMFSEEDLGCLKTLALECAQAVEGHLGTPWVSGGEGGVSRLELLHTFTGTLAGALSPSEVAEAVVDMGMAATSARAGGLWLLADDGASLSLVRSVGSAGPRAEDHVSVPLNRPARMPILDAVRSGSSVWIESCREMEERYPEAFRAFSQGGESSLACITLLAQGRCIGGLALAYAGARRFPPEERAFMKVLGWHSAQAVERTRLYQAQKQARDSAEANRRRSDFLADTSLILGSSLDFSETLSAVALAAVPRIADWCVIQLAEPGVLPVAAHADPAKVPFVLELSRRYRELGKGEHGIQAAIRTGKSELHSFIDAQPLTEGLGHVPEFVALVAKVGLVATMVVPILARGRTLGAIVLASSNTDRRYDERDLALAEDLGRRVGLALDNARLYRDAREADRLNPTDHLC